MSFTVFLLPFLLYDAPVFLGIGRGKVLSWKYRCRRHRNLFSGPSRLALIQEEISVKDAPRVSVQRKELKCYKTNLWITIIEKRKNYDWVMNPRRRDRTTETSLRSMRTYLAIATATTPRKFRGVYQKEHKSPPHSTLYNPRRMSLIKWLTRPSALPF